MKSRIIAVGFAVSVVAFPASAGYKHPDYLSEVSVGGSVMSGLPNAVRNSDDTVQYIGCNVMSYGTTSVALCSARDRYGATRSCWSSAPNFTAQVRSLPTDALILVNIDVNAYTCASIVTYPFSYYSPKMP